MPVKLPTLRCGHCGHAWFPRSPQLPKVCSNCKRSDWNKPANRILRKVQGDPNREFPIPAPIRVVPAECRHHIVYVLLDSDDQPLYVGKSKTGLIRVFSAARNSFKSDALNKTIAANVYFLESSEDATDLEARFTIELRPKYQSYAYQ